MLVLFDSILLFHPSVLFYSVLCSILGSIPLFSPVFSSIRSVRSIGLLFSPPCSLTLTGRAAILFNALLSTRLLRDATVFIFVDRPPCLLQESSSRAIVHEFSFNYRRVGGRRILELGAVFQSSSLFGQPVVRGATFLHQHLSVRIILIESLVAAVIPQVFQRPSQCASIGSLSLVAPTAILIKSLPTVLFCLLGACVGLWVAVFFLFVFFSLALPAEPTGHARFYISYTSIKTHLHGFPFGPTETDSICNLQHITASKVRRELSSLPSKSSTGTDGIFPAGPAVVGPLTTLFNISLRLSRVPDEWKRSLIFHCSKEATEIDKRRKIQTYFPYFMRCKSNGKTTE